MPASARPLPLLGRHSDLLLAVAVVAMVGMLVIPLPTALVDGLIALNIGATVSLLLASAYVPQPLRLTVLPAVLLLGTLFRLALNVSTTRLILLQADAGRIIDAFGDFVVQGNYLVGAVVFAILTTIQFVVIARGGERVAEVAARFTLDAMPGRQMAIDADLRSGAIDLAQAQDQRRTLQQESQLYGAMDGAMKFIKGDAIAGLVIIAVNLGAGLAVGVLQREMAIGDAARTYALLTIGDGLVTQIPALLMATTAGLIVTRVSDGAEGAPLARQIGAQLLSQPKALAVTAALLLVFALIPGLPTLPFLLLAAVLGAAAWAVVRRAAAPGSATRAASETIAAVTVLVPPDASRLRQRLAEALATAGEQLWQERGVQLPPAEWGIGTRAEILLHGAPLWRAPAEDGDFAGAIEAAFGRRAGQLMGVQSVQDRLDELERSQPALVRAVVPRLLGVSALTELLGRLVEEGLSIRNLARILEIVARLGPTLPPGPELVEQVRRGLRAEITRRFAHGTDGSVDAVTLDRRIEDMVRSAIRDGERGPLLSLEAGIGAEIVARVSAVAEHKPLLLLVPGDLRPHVRRLVQTRLPDVVVLAHEELEPATAISIKGRVSMG